MRNPNRGSPLNSSIDKGEVNDALITLILELFLEIFFEKKWN